MSSYTVKYGDTLTGIALHQRMCVKGPGNTHADWADCMNVARKIGAINNLADINVIRPGQVLQLTDDSPDTRLDEPKAKSDFGAWWLGGILATVFGAWWFTRKDGGSFGNPSRSLTQHAVDANKAGARAWSEGTYEAHLDAAAEHRRAAMAHARGGEPSIGRSHESRAQKHDAAAVKARTR